MSKPTKWFKENRFTYIMNSVLYKIFIFAFIIGGTYLWSPAVDVTREIIEHVVIWIGFMTVITLAVTTGARPTIIGVITLVAFIVALIAIFVY